VPRNRFNVLAFASSVATTHFTTTTQNKPPSFFAAMDVVQSPTVSITVLVRDE
jgi:hypothetical protein